MECRDQDLLAQRRRWLDLGSHCRRRLVRLVRIQDLGSVLLLTISLVVDSKGNGNGSRTRFRGHQIWFVLQRCLERLIERLLERRGHSIAQDMLPYGRRLKDGTTHGHNHVERRLRMHLVLVAAKVMDW